MKDALSKIKSFYLRVVASFPRTLINSFEKAFNSLLSVVVLHRTVGIIFDMFFPRQSVIMYLSRSLISSKFYETKCWVNRL